ELKSLTQILECLGRCLRLSRGRSEACSRRPLGSVRDAEDYTAKDARSARSGAGSRSPDAASAESSWRRSRTRAQYMVRMKVLQPSRNPLTSLVDRPCRLIILAADQPRGIRVAPKKSSFLRLGEVPLTRVAGVGAGTLPAPQQNAIHDFTSRQL